MTSPQQFTCLSQEFFDELAGLKAEFVSGIWMKIAPQAATLLPKIFMAWLLFTCLRAMWEPETFLERVKAISQRGFIAALTVAALAATPGG